MINGVRNNTESNKRLMLNDKQQEILTLDIYPTS